MVAFRIGFLGCCSLFAHSRLPAFVIWRPWTGILGPFSRSRSLIGVEVSFVSCSGRFGAGVCETYWSLTLSASGSKLRGASKPSSCILGNGDCAFMSIGTSSIVPSIMGLLRYSFLRGAPVIAVPSDNNSSCCCFIFVMISCHCS